MLNNMKIILLAALAYIAGILQGAIGVKYDFSLGILIGGILWIIVVGLIYLELKK